MLQGGGGAHRRADHQHTLVVLRVSFDEGGVVGQPAPATLGILQPLARRMRGAGALHWGTLGYTGVQWDAVGWSGMGWDAVGWGGMEWDGVRVEKGRSGMERCREARPAHARSAGCVSRVDGSWGGLMGAGEG